ncbi:MAG: bifunctional oligoribonuclease/PAP phosphatase NrnA [Ruminococcus sp.]
MNEKRAAADFLLSHDNYEILTHTNPDGDTLGSGFALCLALQRLGKRARVITDSLPRDFVFLTKDVEEQRFDAETIVSVDVADEKLLGGNRAAYSGRIALCIDHHRTNKVAAPLKCVDAEAASNCEILYDILTLMGVPMDKSIASCLYTGVSTDTGCFKYGNTTSRTHRIAAELLDCGVDAAAINKVMFDTKSKLKLRMEREIYDTMEFYADDRCAIIAITQEMMRRLGVGEDELEGFASLPRQIEGVRIGLTLREKEENVFKISVRSDKETNAAAFCERFGGGGHIEAAGCQLRGTLEEVKARLKAAVDEVL